MKGSKWLVIVIFLLIIGVVVAKEYRNAPEPREASASAGGESADNQLKQGPLASLETGTAAEPFLGAEPQSSSAPSERASDDRQLQPEQPTESVGAETTEMAPSNPGPQSSSARSEDNQAVVEPRPAGPLPGSKLENCLNNGLPTMADFGMGTCKPCKAMEPILKQATQDYWGKVNILFVELDKYPDLARKYRIAAMPTQIFFDASGKQVDSHMGYMDRSEIDRRLAALEIYE